MCVNVLSVCKCVCLVLVEVGRVTGCSETGVGYETPCVLGIECSTLQKQHVPLMLNSLSSLKNNYFRKLFVKEHISVFLHSFFFLF